MVLYMYLGLHAKYRLFLSNFNWTRSSWTDFQKTKKPSTATFRENPSSGSWALPCGRTGRHDQAHSSFSQFCEHS